MQNLPLQFGFEYADLYNPHRLQDLSNTFHKFLEQENKEVFSEFEQYIHRKKEFSAIEEGNLLVAVAPHLSRFIAKLFNIEKEAGYYVERAQETKVIFQFKKEFMGKKYHKNFDTTQSASWDLNTLTHKISELIGNKPITEQRIAVLGMQLIQDEKNNVPNSKENIQTLLQWLYKAKNTPLTQGWVSYRVPHKLNFDKLVELDIRTENTVNVFYGPQQYRRRRDGFKLTDKRMSMLEIDAETDYCMTCHEREKDSCSKGLRNKEKQIERNPLGIKLNGCPLDVKISEFQAVRNIGHSIGALAIIMIDNATVAGTGHRICNDCMKSCIYQKQEPVNIPQNETAALWETLQLPYGFEIFSLLQRWNPLNRDCPVEKPYNGKKVLVVGLGPAGYTLTQYLSREGFGVVGIDGLKLEPWAKELVGDIANGVLPKPIKDVNELIAETDERIITGFGGVSEYGITVRWDKNFLNLTYLALSRKNHVRFYGGVRFGGTITVQEAFDLGFDHIALATGAGKPTIIDIKNNLVRGIRKASDFLMNLQLSGAAKKDSMANVQVRLPAIVIGGGLTAIDTTTEVAAYYPIQVEKVYNRYKRLIELYGEEFVLSNFQGENRIILQEFLEHGKIIAEERERARKAGETPDFATWVQRWGGVKMCYRKRLVDSPAYRLNHEEIHKALEEGIGIIEKLNPVEAVKDEYGALSAIIMEKTELLPDGKWINTGEYVTLPCRSLFVAAGTSPNTVYNKEHKGTFELHPKNGYFKKHKVVYDLEGNPTLMPADDTEKACFTSLNYKGKFVSFYGDNHPDYSGNVVKAMASAKDFYKDVVRVLTHKQNLNGDIKEWSSFAQKLDELLIAEVVEVVRLTPTIVEVIVKAPLAARKFEPGQFYRLQNFESTATVIEGTKLVTEGLALTGAWVDKEKGLLSTIALEMGSSSRMLATLKKGERIVLMGPTGEPTHIPENKNVLLLGGGLGNAVHFSIAKAMKEKGNKVLYFAGYKNSADVFKMDEIEKSTDIVVWSNDIGEPIQPRRPQDKTFTGNILQAMMAYHNGELGETTIKLTDIDHIIVIGSDRMMAAVKQARHTTFKDIFKSEHVAIGSINSPMQCMMKEICAQCLCKHVDPVTGKEIEPVFSCFNQDQELDRVDFANLNERLSANVTLEKLSNLWLTHLYKQAESIKNTENQIVLV